MSASTQIHLNKVGVRDAIDGLRAIQASCADLETSFSINGSGKTVYALQDILTAYGEVTQSFSDLVLHTTRLLQAAQLALEAADAVGAGLLKQ